jgi:t-SNARE complex subunit (syntaxin)
MSFTGGNDLTEEFRKQALMAAPPPAPPTADSKQEKKKKKKASTSNDAELGEAGVDKALKMHEFMLQRDAIDESLKTIKKLQHDIDREHRNALQSATVQESLNTSSSINELTRHVNEHSNRVRRLLKQMETETEEVQPLRDQAPSSFRMRVSQKEHLTGKYMETMKRFQKMQQDCSKKYKDQIKRQYLIVKPDATSKEVDAVLSEEGAQAQVFAMAVRGEAQNELKKMETRCQDMKKLEQSIIELSQLFITLRDQLMSQRDVVAKVGYQIHNTEEYTERALKDTGLAVEYAKRARRIKIIIFSVLASIIFIVVLVISLKLYLAFRTPTIRIA